MTQRANPGSKPIGGTIFAIIVQPVISRALVNGAVIETVLGRATKETPMSLWPLAASADESPAAVPSGVSPPLMEALEDRRLLSATLFGVATSHRPAAANTNRPALFIVRPHRPATTARPSAASAVAAAPLPADLVGTYTGNLHITGKTIRENGFGEPSRPHHHVRSVTVPLTIDITSEDPNGALIGSVTMNGSTADDLDGTVSRFELAAVFNGHGITVAPDGTVTPADTAAGAIHADVFSGGTVLRGGLYQNSGGNVVNGTFRVVKQVP